MRKPCTWDETFMSLAAGIAAMRSKDPNTQVGCVLVDEHQDPIAFGYNGFAPGAYEDDSTWSRPHKYQHVIHAETNAIGRAARRGCKTGGSTCYVTAFPCLPCAKTVIVAGVKRVVALTVLRGWDDDYRAAAEEFDRAGVAWEVIDGT